MGVQWYERHLKRLKAEKIIMNDKFPQFVLKRNTHGGLFWDGILVTNFGTQYRTNIIYPNNYPYQKPIFKVIWPRIKNNSPHLFTDGSICVYPNYWDYKRCTAPSGVPLVASWLVMYEIWLKTERRW